MCLAIFKKENQDLPIENIIEAWACNKDGAGICYRENGKVRIIKGFFNKNEFIDYLLDNYEFFKSIEMMIHLRYSTSGETNARMCHPFALETNNDKMTATDTLTDCAVIHNGVMFNPKLGLGYSDTAIFTRLHAMKNLNHDQINKIIGGNRVCLFGAKENKFYGQWHDIGDGCLYSNLSYFTHGFVDHGIFDDGFWLDDYEICPCCGGDYCDAINSNKTVFECYDCLTVFKDGQIIESKYLNKVGA
jgi:hypothetical protein